MALPVHRAGPMVADTSLITDLDWPVTPHGLVDLLTWMRDTYPTLPPFAITENGAAFDDPVIDGHVADDRRITYLDAHLGRRSRRPRSTRASTCGGTSCGQRSTTSSGVRATGPGSA